MGACATKPKVLLYGGGADSKAPAPVPEPEMEETPKKQQEAVDVNVEQSPEKKVERVEQGQEDRDFDYKLHVHEITQDDKPEGDDQSNKRPSLSLLFKQNEYGKVETEQVSPDAEEKSSVKIQANETVEQPLRQGISETEKPSEDNESNKQVKQEAPDAIEQSSHGNQGIGTAEQTVNEETSEENLGNEAVKQEPTESSGENEGNESAEQQVKQEKSEAKAEKPSEGNQSIEAVKQESEEGKGEQESSEAEEKPSGESEIKETQTQEPIDSTGSRYEPSKSPSETENLETPVITEVLPPTELATERVIQVEIPATEAQKNYEKFEETLTEEVTANTQDKNKTLVEEASKVEIH